MTGSKSRIVHTIRTVQTYTQTPYRPVYCHQLGWSRRCLRACSAFLTPLVATGSARPADWTSTLPFCVARSFALSSRSRDACLCHATCCKQIICNRPRAAAVTTVDTRIPATRRHHTADKLIVRRLSKKNTVCRHWLHCDSDHLVGRSVDKIIFYCVVLNRS